nr:alpha/beta hydrolase [Synechococcus sp. CCY 9618]
MTLQVAHGPGGPPALVFLHGALGNRFNWRPQVELCRERRWQWLACDLAGHGQSSPSRRYSIGRHGRDLARLLERFGIDAPLLCAHSYGVPLALEWARRRPVRGLVLIAGGTHELDPWWERPLVRAMGSAGRHLFRLPAFQALHRRGMGNPGNPRLDRFCAESPIPVTAEPYRSMEIFWGYDFHRRPDPGPWSDVPALVLSGGRDPMFSQAMGDDLAARFVRGRHLHRPDAGHVLMVEQAEVVNSAIVDWIAAEGLDQPRRR